MGRLNRLGPARQSEFFRERGLTYDYLKFGLALAYSWIRMKYRTRPSVPLQD
jgi:hypothetical protein